VLLDAGDAIERTARNLPYVAGFSEGRHEWTVIYFLGYAIVIGGIFAGLQQAGVLEQIGTKWTRSGSWSRSARIMLAVARGGTKQTIDIERN